MPSVTSSDKIKGCCLPAREAGSAPAETSRPAAQGALTVDDFEAVLISGGSAMVGTKKAMIKDDGESPLRRKMLRPFMMSSTTVTNAQFQTFVEATGYVTEAERIGWSFVFWSDVPKNFGPTQGVPGVNWWRKVEGSNWKAIHGPGSEAAVLPEHPVVQVSYRDALAYADWVGGRLPSEAVWEHAARGGLGDVKFPWGDQSPNDTDFTPCNIWQGSFPHVNSARDGYAHTAPAKAFAPNAYGLYQMVGNVWEWTSDTYRVKSLKSQVKKRLEQMKGFQLSKGGSYLCHKSYCFRYRIAGRSGTSPDSAAPHHGFRVIWSAG